EAWQMAWKKLADDVWQYATQKYQGLKQACSIWQRQVSQLWSCQWVVGEAALLERRKLLRDFPDDLEPEEGLKCTVCGRREALHGPLSDMGVREALREYWSGFSQALGHYDIRRDGSERLCAICTIRRLLPRVWEAAAGKRCDDIVAEMVNYPSTRTIATMPWRIAVARCARRDARVMEAVRDVNKALVSLAAEARGRGPGSEPIEDVSKAISAMSEELLAETEGTQGLEMLLKYDGDWLTEDGIRVAVKDRGWVSRDSSLEGERDTNSLAAGALEVIEKLRALGDALGNAGAKPQPSDFYAVLVMDGDNMGAILSKHEQKKSTISRSLEEFASSVRAIVHGCWGRLVYAGGDDVLALLPVDTALDAAEQLRRKYAKTRPKLDSDGSPVEPDSWTISAGIVFTHCAVPLTTVIARAHELLDRHAKDGAGRNAFAVEVWKRGGPILRFARKWDVAGPAPQASERDETCRQGGNDTPSYIDHLTNFVKALLGVREGLAFSNRILYRLREVCEIMTEPAPEGEGPGRRLLLSEEEFHQVVQAEYLKTRSLEHETQEEAKRKAERFAQEVWSLCLSDSSDLRIQWEPLLFARFL
ncbi:MAG: type III-B CRISPR-associated protein Cas10/Cmr2, partial [Armatimonadetes bacterium]|nr:type III-B CRISPR-associated protein Cas10/Cmr2 [Armatimonadota bacterium]